MTRNRSHRHILGVAGTFGLATSLVTGLIFGFAFLHYSSASAANVVDQQTSSSVTIAAGATATLNVRGFCLDFGKPFPTQNMSPNSLADDKVRAALNYSIQKGYTDSNPQQVEQAIWFLRDSTWHNQADHVLGQEIVNNATTANAPASTGDGVALNDAVAQNVVTLTAQFVARTADHFYGDATVQIKNTGSADIKIFMPVGTVFTVPGGNGQFQDLASYTIGAQSAQPTAQASATTQATTTAEPTTTVGATTTAEATSTTAAISTVAPTETTAPAPTIAPTVAPAATPTVAVSTLPATGRADGQNGPGNMLLAVMLAAALVLVGIKLMVGFDKVKRY